MAETKKRILVGEDETALAHALEIKLTKEGFDVTLAVNGEEILKALDEESYDGILMDIIMPKMDGFAALTELRKRGIKTPVMITSNLGQKEDMEKAKALGAQRYVIKSNTQISEIIAQVKQLIT